MITLFHRSSTAEYAAPCDVADSLVLDAAGKPAGFIGAAWGEHVAQDAVHSAICEPEDVEPILASWGLKRPALSFGGPDA